MPISPILGSAISRVIRDNADIISSRCFNQSNATALALDSKSYNNLAKSLFNSTGLSRQIFEDICNKQPLETTPQWINRITNLMSSVADYLGVVIRDFPLDTTTITTTIRDFTTTFFKSTDTPSIQSSNDSNNSSSFISTNGFIVMVVILSLLMIIGLGLLLLHGRNKRYLDRIQNANRPLPPEPAPSANQVAIELLRLQGAINNIRETDLDDPGSDTHYMSVNPDEQTGNYNTGSIRSSDYAVVHPATEARGTDSPQELPEYDLASRNTSGLDHLYDLAKRD